MTTPAITALLEVINSKRDVNGNCYWAFRYTDCQTGKVIEATISGGESNVNAAKFHLAVDGKGINFTRTELPIRQFNRFVKPLPYAGCHPLVIAAYIQQAVTGQWCEFYISRSKQLTYPIGDLSNLINKNGGIITGTQEVDGAVCLFFKVPFDKLGGIQTDVSNLVRYLDQRIELKKE